jgi:phosphoglycolate phosphatase
MNNTGDNMPRVDLLIFDLDGTLVDSRQDLAAAVNQTLAFFNLPPLSTEMVVKYVGDGVNKLLERSLADPEPARVEEAVKIFREYYSQHLLDHSDLYPGVRQALSRLVGRQMAVVTNKPTEFSERILQGLGVREFFSLVLGGDAVSEMKPSPAPIVEVLERLEINKDAAVMIGDSRGDIVAGREAGVWTCWVSWGFRTREEVEGIQPDFVAAEPVDWVRLFDSDQGSSRD